MCLERRLIPISFFQRGRCFKSELSCSLDDRRLGKKKQKSFADFPRKQQFLVSASPHNIDLKLSYLCCKERFMFSCWVSDVFAFAIMCCNLAQLALPSGLQSKFFWWALAIHGLLLQRKDGRSQAMESTLESLQHGRLAFVLSSVFRFCWTI